MAGIKRAPQVDNENIMWRALDIPKSEWIEMYFDLYRQTCGDEQIDGEEIMQDAEKRRQILFNKSPKKRAKKDVDRPAFWWETKEK